MGKGGYLGGSTVIKTGQSKQFDFEHRSGRKKKKTPLRLKPGLHLLTREERREILRKVRLSRKLSEQRSAEKARLEQERKKNSFAKFSKDVKSLTGE